MRSVRGLFALITLIFVISTTQLFAEVPSNEQKSSKLGFFYLDEVVFLDYVYDEIDKIGKELQEATGVALYVVVIKELPKEESIRQYAQELMEKLRKPAVLLILSEYDKRIDIIASDETLYERFDKEQILSPFPARGTILPILTMKAKKATMSEKFGAAIQNGYTDIAEQIALSYGKKLKSVPESANKEVFMVLRVLFYGFILYALYLFIKRKYTKRVNEKR